VDPNAVRDLTSPDSVLLECVAAGEERALWELSARHGASLYALAYSILGDAARAEEALRRTYEDARYDAARFDPTHFPVLRWLSDVTREHALELARATSACGQS